VYCRKLTFNINKRKVIVVIKFIFRSKKNKNETIDDFIRHLDGQYAKMSIEFEELRILREKVEKIDSKLREMESMMSKGRPLFQTYGRSSKTREAIKLILQKHGELTSLQLGRLMKLSRTRCNEYLKEMELEGMTMSRIDSRKKLYKIRQ
jgi:hypothetical protein